MSIRAGESWQGRNGRRYWVSYPLLPFGCLGVVLLPFALMFWAACWLLLAELWLCVEFYVLAISGVYVLIRWAFDPATRFRSRFAQAGWFWYLTA